MMRSAGALWQFLRRRQLLLSGGGITFAMLALAIASQFWTPEPPTKMYIAARLRAPFSLSLLGTDHFGRDIASMLMVGAWNSLSVAFSSVAIGLTCGAILGAAAAALRGWFDEAIMRFADVIFAFPAVLSAIMIGALLGPGIAAAVIAIGIFNIPVFARLTRGAALQIWVRDFVLAARAAGKGGVLITLEHILPNIGGLLAVQATTQLALAILTEAGLSFLGIGVSPPNPSWGRMLNDAQTHLDRAPHLAILPGLAIAVTVLGLNMLGDGLRDLIDPKSRRQRRC